MTVEKGKKGSTFADIETFQDARHHLETTGTRDHAWLKDTGTRAIEIFRDSDIKQSLGASRLLLTMQYPDVDFQDDVIQ